MRIRSTRPEFWRSKTIAQLDWDVRLVLKGLESYVDDNGVGKDDIALIAADVFPRDLSGDPPETLRRLTEAVSILHEAGLIARYTIDGEQLLYIDRWADIQYIQKPGKGRFPRPDGTLEYSQKVSPESYRKSPEGYRTKAGEQGSRGAGTVGTTEVCHQSACHVAPAQKCPRHINDPNPPDCGGCASANREYRRWKAGEVKREAAESEQRNELVAAIRACPDCDDFGRDDDLNLCPKHPSLKEVSHA